MLKKRIIACLDIDQGRTVKGIKFKDIQDAGDPIELAQQYVKAGVDELVFLDINASVEKRKATTSLMRMMSRYINIPFTIGGGISTLDDVARYLEAGADKVSINSAAVADPQLINRVAKRFGQQCVTLAIDSKRRDGLDYVCVQGGRKRTTINTADWAAMAENLGAGEILLTSMDHDGTKNGFAIQLLNRVNSQINIPLIASGGAGSIHHFFELFTQTKAQAGLAASIFHYGEISIAALKNSLQSSNIPIR